MSRETYTLTINGQTIEIPCEYVLVRRDLFIDISKTFRSIAQSIDKYKPDPQNRKQHGLIYARAEARDGERIMKEIAVKEGTTGIWFMK